MAKAPKRYSGDEVKRYLGSLKEHFDDGVKAIGEKVDFLSEKMDRKFDGVDKRFEGVDKRFEGIEKRLDSHTEMIGTIMVDVETIKKERRNYHKHLTGIGE